MIHQHNIFAGEKGSTGGKGLPGIKIDYLIKIYNSYTTYLFL